MEIERLLLRKFTERNMEVLFFILKDKEANKFLPSYLIKDIEQVKPDGLPYITATRDRNNPCSGNVMKTLGMSYKYSQEALWQIPVTFRMYQLNFEGNNEQVDKEYGDRNQHHFVENL